MVSKQALDTLLKRIKKGAIKVTYWDGITATYGTGKPYNHLTIKSPTVVRAMIKNASIGFGESYMNGLMDISGSIDGIMRLVSENTVLKALIGITAAVRPRRLNTKRRQKALVQHHYDLGNDFYKLWLDKSMTYSCAYFKKPTDSLEQAQKQKVEHILRKLQLQKGQRLLDIGSGWGTLLITAAQEYGVKGLGITLSEQQLKHSKEAAKKAGVDHLISFELKNYQTLAKEGTAFDRIVSVGMFEHVGQRNQKAYYKAVDQILKVGGVSVLHTITQDREWGVDPWIDKYIFPGTYVPAYREVVHQLPKYNFRLVDYENLRIHYAMTLDEWLRRFEAHKNWILDKYDERFYRMWRFYLASCSAGFRYGMLSLSQYVFTKGLTNDLPLTREHIYK